ncbi:hypothetical protein KKE06_04460 [Candidatus Micrarchaeota archaeon]|nr:hypothetical protein [Candidatus Micrarchaeota archaeon]
MDEYIDIGIRGVMDTDKMFQQNMPSLNDFQAIQIAKINALENLLIGLEIVKGGKDENGEPTEYQNKVDEARKMLDKEKTKDWNLTTQYRFGLFRFRLMIGLIANKDPATVIFEA